MTSRALPWYVPTHHRGDGALSAISRSRPFDGAVAVALPVATQWPRPSPRAVAVAVTVATTDDPPASLLGS
jgi:hypothetical protein